MVRFKYPASVVVDCSMSVNGIAELPLHDGRVPEYLLKRMKILGSLIARYIIEEHGVEELLSRLSNPLWFQAFSNVIGMDWDSSGSTTVVLYVLKGAFPPAQARKEGVAVLGGKGVDARELPREAEHLEGWLNANQVIETSRVSAKIDSVALQDGYVLYVHGVLISETGEALVIQQGMNLEKKVARRYHIHVKDPDILNCEKDPHSGVASLKVSPSLNMVDAESARARKAILEIVESTPVDSIVRELHEVNRMLKGLPPILLYAGRGERAQAPSGLREKVLKCPSFYRPVIDVKRVAAVAEAIKREAPGNFRDLLLIRGLGPEALRAIALVADLIYGYEPSFKDPTTHPLDPFLYAYAHGGKDGVPYRVRVREMDKTIEFFAEVIDRVRSGDREKKTLLRNLSKFVSRIRRIYGL